MAHDRDQIDRRIGPPVRIEFDARQRQQIVDQPRHAARLLLHDRQKTLARLGVVARRTLQRLDEAGQRRKRGTQFVTGVGDEIGAHFLDAAQRRQIAKGQQHEVRDARIGRALDRHSNRLEPAIDRHPFGIFDALLFAPRTSAVDRLGQFRHPQSQGDWLTLTQRRRQRARRFVKGDHPAVAVEGDDRIGQTRHYGAQRIAAALGSRQRRRNLSALLAVAHRQ